MDFATLKSEVFRRIEESQGTPVFWTVSDVAQAINDGYEEISDATEWYETNQTIPANTALTVAGSATGYYDLSNLTSWPLAVRFVWNPNTSRWLEPGDHRDLDEARTQWERVTGEPDTFVIRGLWWLGTFPRRSTGNLKIYHTAIPASLSVGADTPGFPAEFHPGLIEWAMYDLKSQEGEIKIASAYYDRYQLYEQRLKSWVDHRISLDRVGGWDHV